MTLIALTRPPNIESAFSEILRRFNSGGVEFTREIVCQGGNQAVPLRWFPECGFWASINRDDKDKHWCAFGVADPTPGGSLDIACEINLAPEGVNKLVGGLLVRSDNGTIYLAHSGGIAGGRIGVGKAAFLKFYGDETLDSVVFPGKDPSDYIIISALDDDDFVAHVGAFVHKVAEFKAKAVKR